MDDQIVDASVDILLPVIECSHILAGEYAKACGRGTLTSMDLKYAMMYAARNVTGHQIGTLFPEIYDDESDSSDEDEIETVDEDDEPFTRYEGDTQLMNDINSAHDTWDEWEPASTAESILKSSINKVHDL
jgi:hypothetical protein